MIPGLGLAIGKLALAGGKAIKGRIDEKKADGAGAGLVDHRQVAMANLTRRMLRARETGTSDLAGRRNAAATGRMMSRRSITSGGRSLAPIQNMINQAQGNITENAKQERLGLLGSLVQQETNVADRRMDLVEKQQSQDRLDATARKDVGSKNFWAQGEKIQDLLTGGSLGDTPKQSNKQDTKKNTGGEAPGASDVANPWD